jgi:glycosyltransferase involved in cell wall biosynthesis
VSTPFFSVIVATCRGDYPFVNSPDDHVLDRIVDCCEKQTFKDFELIIVDLMYDYRSDYLKERIAGLDFPVLHVIDKDSIFRDLMMIRICSAKNTGLLYARGQCVIFSDDGQDWSEDAFEQLHGWGSHNAGATCRLHRDNGFGPVEIDSRWHAYKMQGELRTKLVPAHGIGYLGGSLSMVPMERMLQCNGWDEMFDGSRQLEDADMARRLGATGLKMALEGHPQVVEYKLNPCDSQLYRQGLLAKCNGSYIYPIWDKQPNRIRANDRLLTDQELDKFLWKNCPQLQKDSKCMTSKEICEGEKIWNRRSLLNIYKDQRLVFDLEELRAERSWEIVAEDPILLGEKTE